MEGRTTLGEESRYRIGEILGVGGMATVSRAYDTLLRRDVAIKTIATRDAFDEATRERFLIEARAAAAIIHPNVVAVYDVLVDASHPAIVMEYVGGGSLAALLRREGALPPERAVAYARQIAAALAAAHARGIVHRDIKPSNVLISPDGTRIKVADFGIAKLEYGDDLVITQTGRLLCSAQYASPEQAMGSAPAPASDLYSLGVVLHEMLTGNVPFAANGALASAVAHVTQPAPSRETLSRSMPPALAAVVHRLLRKDPAERFTTAREVNAALAAIALPARSSDDVGRSAAQAAGTARALDEHRTPLALTALAALLLVVIVWAGTRPPMTALADVRRTQVLHARAMLAARGLVTAIVERTDTTIPAGSVIDQQPAAGTPMQRGDLVRLIVGSGPPLVIVPELRGRTFADARAAIERLPLDVTFGAQSSASPPGTVLAQDPPSGAHLRPGSTETVVISAGSPEAGDASGTGIGSVTGDGGD